MDGQKGELNELGASAWVLSGRANEHESFDKS